MVDVRRREVLNTVLLDGIWDGAANPWGIACTADGRWICVSHAGTHELSVIDAPLLLSTLEQLPLVAFSNAAFFDGSSDVYTRISNGEDLVNAPGFLAGFRQRVKLPGVGPRPGDIRLAGLRGGIFHRQHRRRSPLRRRTCHGA